MRKQIDIPDSMIRDLRLLAVLRDKSVKKLMEDAVIGVIKDHLIKTKVSVK